MKLLARCSLRTDCSGAFSLEAAMVLPWIMIFAVLTLLFALFVSLQSQLYYSASVTAERAAFAWSNSAKDAKTGAYSAGHYDGLYWRLKDDALLQGWLGSATTGDGTVSVPLGASSDEASASSVSGKLKRLGYAMPDSMPGIIEYRNIGIKRTVTVKAHSDWLPEALVKFRGQEPASAEVSAIVIEPVELIRTFDFIRYYTANMKDAPQGASAYREEAREVLVRREP